jgi:hypothetical protein
MFLDMQQICHRFPKKISGAKTLLQRPLPEYIGIESQISKAKASGLVSG